MTGPIYFAIGDIHGEADKLDRLHTAILDRITFEGRDAVIVHLGDYVDRGPDSRRVIDRIMALERRHENNPSIEVVSLLGNHEQMMLEQIEADDSLSSEAWFSYGGLATLNSYIGHPSRSMSDWRASVPSEHIAWLRQRPTLLYDKERRLAFVHAGIEPETFPECSPQTRLWIRSDRFFIDANWPEREELKGLTVIHGHTPTDGFVPEVTMRRINVDTGACFGGPLTAVMLKDDNEPTFLRAG